MTVVIGLDLSLTGTGVARWENGHVTMQTIGTRSGESLYRRIALITGRLWTNLPSPDTSNPVMVIAEERLTAGTMGRGAMSNSLDIAELRGVIKYGLYRRGIPVAEMHPSRLKKYATGRGDAKKDDMVKAAWADLYEKCGWPGPLDHNQADAAWLLAGALDNFGRPPVHVTPARAAVLRHTTWPVFALEG
jgi:Holliday junction resolvasome RuvABC endonuclease subunit